MFARRLQALQQPPLPLSHQVAVQAGSSSISDHSRDDGGATRSRDCSSGSGSGSLEFRLVSCEGTWDEAHSLFVGPRARTVMGVAQPGFFLVTPLIPTTPTPTPTPAGKHSTDEEQRR